MLLFDQTDYLNCVCLGLILDPEGRKMSKRLGNIVDPHEVIDAHGADAFRWYYLASQQPWAGYRFSADTVGESVRQFLLTLWNTYSFYVLYANTEASTRGPPPPGTRGYRGVPGFGGVRRGLDRWAVSRLQATTEFVRERLDGFDSTSAGKAIAAYVDELSNWYVRVGRRRFWRATPPRSAPCGTASLETAKLLAPFIPFTADAIWPTWSTARASASTGVRPPRRLPRCRPGASRPRSGSRDGGGPARRRARPRGPRPGEGEDAPAAREGGDRRDRRPSAARSRASPRSSAPSSTSATSSSSPRRASSRARRSGPTSAPSARGSARICPGPRCAIEALDADHVRGTIEAGGQVGISVDGREHTLGPDELSFVMQPLDGYQVESEAGRAVALALDLDDDLIREGLAREVVRAVQNARKEAGLEITDRIALGLGGDAELLAAVRAHEGYVTGEALATSIAYDGSGDAPLTVDGRPLLIAVRRAG